VVWKRQEMRSFGACYFWSNRQESRDKIFSRIDRAVHNIDSFLQFGDVVKDMAESAPDQSTIEISGIACF